MNWGKKVLFLYISFAGLMTFMVIMSFRQKTDLVTTDYYAEELIFQQQIDASNNAKPFMDSIFITLDNNNVLIKFPADFYAQATGEVYFYKASDSEYDHKFPLQLDSIGTQQFNKSTFMKGFYTLKIKWAKENKKYYLEKNIVL